MNKILIIVDLQKGFLVNKENYRTKNNLIKILKKDYFDYVIATRFVNYDNSSFERLLNYKQLKTDDEKSLIPEIFEYADKIIDKTNYSCVNTGLLPLLIQGNNGAYPQEVFVAGIDTDGCVLSTVVDLFNVNITPKVLIDCCSSTGGTEYHETAIKLLKRLIGKKQLIFSSDLIS